jgi:DNA-binding MarR family transcriptional regulator
MSLPAISKHLKVLERACLITRSRDAQWRLRMLNTVTLTDHGEKTTLTLRSRAYEANEEERATFRAGRTSMQGGFTGTIDQLAAYLLKARS